MVWTGVTDSGVNDFGLSSNGMRSRFLVRSYFPWFLILFVTIPGTNPAEYKCIQKLWKKVCVKAKKIAPKCDFRRKRRGLFFVCPRIRFGINGRSIIYSTEFLCCLPKATHNRIERLFHRSFDIQYHMQMVWHQAKLKDTHMRINSPHFEYLLYDFLSQLRPLDIRLFRIILRNDEFSQQGFTRRDSQCHMVYSYAFPSRTWRLSMPIPVSHQS